MVFALHYTNTAILEKWVPYSQRYLFNAIRDTNHNANPNHNSKDNPNLAKQSACIALYYRDTWNVMERAAIYLG